MSIPAWLSDVPLAPEDEELLAYENNPGTSDDAVLAGRHSIYAKTLRRVGRISYLDMAEMDHLRIHTDSDSLTMEEVDIGTSDGDVIDVPVRGGNSDRTRWSQSVVSVLSFASQVALRGKQ